MDVRLRQAVVYAIDRQQIVEALLGGRTRVMHTLQPEGAWASPLPDSLNPYRYDPERATLLLEAAGWQVGDDGVRTKDGRRFAIDFYTTEGNRMRAQVAQVIAEQLRQVGIAVTIQVVPATEALFAEGEGGILAGGHFDLALYAWQSGLDPALYLYGCDEIPNPDNDYYGLNYPGYCNPTYDRLANQVGSLIEPAARAPLFVEAQQIINRELPTLPLYQDVLIVAYRRGVSGIDLDGSAPIDVSFPEELAIDGGS
jgi:peptide/nickel transport system substrate-binding protein